MTMEDKKMVAERLVRLLEGLAMESLVDGDKVIRNELQDAVLHGYLGELLGVDKAINEAAGRGPVDTSWRD